MEYGRIRTEDSKANREHIKYLNSLKSCDGNAPKPNDNTICILCKKEYTEWRDCHHDLSSYKICKDCNTNRWSNILIYKNF